MTPKVKGSQPWALILCNASDQDAPGWPGLDYFNALIANPGGNGLYTWWQQVSGGNLDLAGSKVFGWYRLSSTFAEIAKMGSGDQVAAARNAATASGADLSPYRHTLSIITATGGGGQNVGTDAAFGIYSTNGQPGWRWCRKCEGLAYWDGSRSPGHCIAGDRHDHSGSGLYSLPHDTSFPDGEDGWRWCNKCEALIYGTVSPAPCPAGGTHSLGSSADYVLRQDGTGTNEQQNWKWCSQCQALAYWDGSRPPGPCPVNATGRHDQTNSRNYSIPIAYAACLGAFAHESGHGFGLVHAYGPSRSGDIVNDGSPGAYGDWTDVMSWANTAAFTVPLFTPAGAGLSAPTLNKLGWLSGSDVATVVAPAPAQSLTLGPLYGAVAGGVPRMICVIEPTQGWIYTAEYRVPLSWDQGIANYRIVIHAMRTLYQAGQDGWRHCTNCEGLIYAGQTACPAGGVHDPSGSDEYFLSVDNPFVRGGQSNWRWCSKCSGLFFAGNPAPGACPAGGQHDGSQSGDYTLELPDPFAGWQWCNKCQGLAFVLSGTPGVCPAGGLHNHDGSGAYDVYTSSGPGRQDKWRRCNKCQGLYYAGLGACMGGPVHLFNSNDYGYAPAVNLAGAAGQAGWRYCRKCYEMAFNDGSRPPGACPAGGTHDHSASGNYVIPIDAEASAGQRQWHRCTKCSALNYVDSTRGPGTCPAGGNHNPDGQYLLAHDTDAVQGAMGFHWCRKCENMVVGDNPTGCQAGGNHDTSASANYVVRRDPASLMREESFWRTCTKCSSLFRLLTTDGSAEGPCAGSGTHSAAPGEYFLTYATSDPFWRWCQNCESMAFWDGSRPPGPCPAGGTHNHSGSACYIPPSFTIDVTQVVEGGDNLPAGSSWKDPGNRVLFEVLSWTQASAIVRVTAT